MNTPALHLRDIETVLDETGLSRERVLELRATPRPAGNPPFALLADWMEANALAGDVNARYAAAILQRLGPKTGHRRHDTGTGPIVGIAGGPHPDTLRTGYGPCQRCDREGELRLVRDRWLCEKHAQHEKRRENFREMVRKAAA